MPNLKVLKNQKYLQSQKTGQTVVSTLEKRRNLVAISIFACTSAFLGVFFYWRLGYYYYLLDELTMLSEFYDVGWKSVIMPQNEHFTPLFKLVFFVYLKLFGNAAGPLHEFKILSHIGTAILGGYLGFVLTKDKVIAVCVGLLLTFSPLIWETMFWQSGVATVMSVFLWLAALACLFRYQEFSSVIRGGDKYLWWGLFFLVLQSYTFGNNLFYPIVALGFAILGHSGKRVLIFTASLALLIINGCVFLFLGSFERNQGYQDPFGVDTVIRMCRYFFVSFYTNITRTVLAYELPGSFPSTLIRWELFVPFLFLLTVSLYAALKDKRFRVPILLGWMNYGLLIGLISVSRYRLPLEQSQSSRYIYLIYPAAILIFAPAAKFFTERFKVIPTILFTALVVRYLSTYSIVERERINAETLHARNYQLIVYAKSHPEVSINDFLTTAYLPTPRVVALLNWLEINKRINVEHRIPDRLKRPRAEIRDRIIRPE